ncbi:MAG: hypothetical protein HC822_00190 [Oscillochloris sp.]|nr:hypothetical protein [Oscillochloris sp.]
MDFSLRIGHSAAILMRTTQGMSGGAQRLEAGRCRQTLPWAIKDKHAVN